MISHRMRSMVNKYLLRHPALLARLVDFYALRHRSRVLYEASGAYFAVRNGRREIRVAASHGAYAVDLVREFDLYFGAVASKPVAGRDVCDFSAPRLHVVPAFGVELMFTSLPEAVDTCNTYLDALDIEPGQVVLDAGAYCGLTAFLFARAVGPTGRVVSVEADPSSFACLESNIARLGVANVTAVNAALWRTPGSLRFSTEGNLGSAVVDLATRQEVTVEVRAVTMLDLAAELRLTRVDRVKMDIEGAEYDVLMSSGDFRGLGYRTSKLRQAERERFPLIRCVPG
jgi:FkbM family methyltransferase